LANHALDQKFVSASLSMDADYDAGTHNLLADVNGNSKFSRYSLFPSYYFLLRPFRLFDQLKKFVILPGALMMDHENKKEIDSMTTQLLEQLNSLQDKHDGDISDINIEAEKCLVKDYLVY